MYYLPRAAEINTVGKYLYLSRKTTHHFSKNIFSKRPFSDLVFITEETTVRRNPNLY
jgi:hypothetical protein|tara:strand:- start:4129 stop:4299 length:171 start_codon:yes stop_codon:yes gene_type:complete